MPKHRAKSLDDNVPDELDFSKLVPIIGHGLFSDEAAGIKATYIVVDDISVSFNLADGRRVSAPLTWYPRLLNATPAERNDWELRSDGQIVIWRSLQLGIAAKAIVDGTKSTESAKALNAWLAGRKPSTKRKKSA